MNVLLFVPKGDDEQNYDVALAITGSGKASAQYRLDADGEVGSPSGAYFSSSTTGPDTGSVSPRSPP